MILYTTAVTYQHYDNLTPITNICNGINVVAVNWSVAEDFFPIGLVKSPHHNPALLHTTDSLLMHVLLQHTSSTFCDKVSRFGRQEIQPL